MELVLRAENFWWFDKQITRFSVKSCESRNKHRYAVVVQDLAIEWIRSDPCKTKISQETQKRLKKFLVPTRKPKVSYTDNSLEFGKACEDLSWNHCTSTPHQSESNGFAERAVRRVKEVTSAVLLQSGLNENWWADSMECETYLRNVTDLLSDGTTPYERRFGQPFNGPIISFGSLVEYYPISVKDQSRIHQFGKKVLPGLFLGYALYAGRIWKGDVLVADLEELETMDASEIHSNRLNAKEVIFHQKENLFSNRRWTNQTPWRRSRPGNTHLDTAATNSRRKSSWFSWRIRRVSSTTSRPFSGCRWSDKWLLVHVRKLHIPPSRWTQSQTLLAETRIIPYSTEKKNDVSRTTHTNLDVKQERETHRWLLEHRWIKRLVWSMDKFHSIYSIGRKTSKRIYVVRGEIDEKTAHIHARSSMARTLGENGKECQTEKEAKVVTWKAPSGKCTKITRDLFHWPWGQRIQRNHQECSQEIGDTNGSRYALQNYEEQEELWEWCIQ